MVDDEVVLFDGFLGVDAHIDLGRSLRRQCSDLDLRGNFEVSSAQLLVHHKHGVVRPSCLSVIAKSDLLVDDAQLVLEDHTIRVFELYDKAT